MAAAQHLCERLPFQQFHHQEMLPLVLLDGVNGADVRMIQRGRGTCLTLKALNQLAVLSHFRRQEFHGHMPSEPRVLGLVDHTHAAAAQLPCDFVV